MKRRFRSDQRGAAMVESLILIPVFIIIDIALIYMYSAYDTRLATMRDARRDVWPYALGACEGSSSARTRTDGNDSSLASLQGDFSKGTEIAKGNTLKSPLETKLSVGYASAERSSKSSNQIDKFKGMKMTTETRVLCNEVQDEVSKSDIRKTINSLYGDFLQ